jgi:hypothetical protein
MDIGLTTDGLHSGHGGSSGGGETMARTIRSLRAAVLAPVLLACVFSVEAGAAAAAERCRPPLEPWDQVELYLGRGLGGDAVVSEEAFQDFLAEVVTPRFPEGLSVVDVAGQFRVGEEIVREPTKLLILLVPDAAEVAPEVGEIIAAYKERFDQLSVLQAEHPVCVVFS